MFESPLTVLHWEEARRSTKARPCNFEAIGGLLDLVEIREGDALKTLSVDLPESIDVLLLDGAKSLYTDVLSLVESRLRPGAVIVADNTDNTPSISHTSGHPKMATCRFLSVSTSCLCGLVKADLIWASLVEAPRLTKLLGRAPDFLMLDRAVGTKHPPSRDLALGPASARVCRSSYTFSTAKTLSSVQIATSFESLALPK